MYCLNPSNQVAPDGIPATAEPSGPEPTLPSSDSNLAPTTAQPRARSPIVKILADTFDSVSKKLCNGSNNDSQDTAYSAPQQTSNPNNPNVGRNTVEVRDRVQEGVPPARGPIIGTSDVALSFAEQNTGDANTNLPVQEGNKPDAIPPTNYNSTVSKNHTVMYPPEAEASSSSTD